MNEFGSAALVRDAAAIEPIRDADQQLYLFAKNNPIDGIDLFGLACCVKSLKVVEHHPVYGSYFSWWSTKYGALHHVEFKLETSSAPKDCVIMNFITSGWFHWNGTPPDVWTTAKTLDVKASSGDTAWWNGTDWGSVGYGKGMNTFGATFFGHMKPDRFPSWTGGDATFYDAPGVWGIKKSNMLALHTAAFQVEISDASGGTVRATLDWATVNTLDVDSSGSVWETTTFSSSPAVY